MTSETIAAVEDAISGARELSHNIIAWESRWPLNTYRARDASKLSQAMLDLAARGDALTLDDYRRDGATNATSAAPPITRWRGNSTPASRSRRRAPRRPASPRRATRAFVIPGSMLGVPAISLPVLRDDGLPLGLQLIGFADADAALFATAGGVHGRVAARLTGTRRLKQRLLSVRRDRTDASPPPLVGAGALTPSVLPNAVGFTPNPRRTAGP